jgi:hypothetical protein
MQNIEQNAHKVFAGKSILVIGGSTSRDLAADFMQMVLTPDIRSNVTRSWEEANVQGYQLFPAVGKRQFNFDKQYDQKVMQPLKDAGWNFTHHTIHEYAGCSDCKSAFVNIDYVAKLHGGHTASSNGISYEFSWKPDMFAPISDKNAFENRYCPPNNQYDIVYIGRGLHDAAFQSEVNLAKDASEGRIQKLGKLLDCFPPETLIAFRTPYVSTQSNEEQEKVMNITSSIVRLVNEGVFGRLNRTLLIDGNLLTSSEGHPVSFDGHHYDSSLARSIWRLIVFSFHQFSHRKATILGRAEGYKNSVVTDATSLHPFQEILLSNWKECGITAV